jgi:hypothetical protein
LAITTPPLPFFYAASGLPKLILLVPLTVRQPRRTRDGCPAEDLPADPPEIQFAAVFDQIVASTTGAPSNVVNPAGLVL